jgi:hypothetical protein
MDPSAFELSLEQQFEVRRLQQEVEGMDHDQAVDFLLKLAEEMMIKDNMIRDLTKRGFI